MAAYIANTLANLTPVSVTGGAGATLIAAADAAQVMVKLYSPGDTPSYWGGSAVSTSTGIPFVGESEWIPTSVAVYVASDVDVTIRGVKGT